MDHAKKLYPSGFNPLYLKPSRPLAKEVAVVGAASAGQVEGAILAARRAFDAGPWPGNAPACLQWMDNTGRIPP